MKEVTSVLDIQQGGSRIKRWVGRLKRDARTIWNDRSLYWLALPGILYFIIFKYIPMYGVSIAFKNYNLFKGIAASPWNGFENFALLFSNSGFLNALKNTVVIGLAKVLFGFPVPIILALMINEIRNKQCRKLTQTAVFLPYFISWVIISGFMYTLFSPTAGALPEFLRLFGYTGTMSNIMQTPSTFKSVIVISYIWRESGYSTVMYMAAIAGIDSQLYEAASIDGAGKLRQIWSITLPSIRTTIIILLVLRMGSILDAGFDQIFVMTNAIVNRTADIIDTYVYQLGIKEAKYHLATAAGLFKSLVSLLFVLGTNYIAKKIDSESGLI